ncbi:TadE/TadG family type IV pilus assembly protein [Agromyces aurantiacus]|uniref:TadE/TadG family type IV pilus assembly protein n=1 Tax=Agromyces aurantiacus TaxID=165814 RepID=A0ABV9R537_9MICO|nr:TadE/TadG family type IV pilus assembly protein [Agromyces aurantiacus]MBM7503276.1 Flp pilus assembly protein TadG [Agromyces aurantiacus]
MEFALIIPALLLLVLGVMEFSRLYNVQISLSNAARSAARVMAIANDAGTAVDAGIDSAPSLNPALSGGNFGFSPGTCASGAVMSVTVTYTTTLLTGAFGPSLTLQGKAATPCGG